MDFKKLMFWKKDDDLGPELGFHDDGVQGMRDEIRPGGEFESNIGMNQPKSPDGFDNLRHQPRSFQSLQNQQTSQNQQSQNLVSKELEIISSKLDTIKGSLENLNQRLANLERRVYGRKSSFYDEMPPRTY